MTNTPRALTNVGRGFVNVQTVKELDDQEEARPSKRIKVDKGAADEAEFAKQGEEERSGPLVVIDADYVCPPSRG